MTSRAALAATTAELTALNLPPSRSAPRLIGKMFHFLAGLGGHEAVGPFSSERMGRRSSPETWRNLSDEALMALHVAGAPAAFDELVRRYRPQLDSILTRAAGSDAPDLLQQVFLRVHRARSSFVPGACLRPWLFTIAYNLVRAHRRKLRQARSIRWETLAWRPARPCAPEARLELRRVLDQLRRLPEPERRAIETACSDRGGAPSSAHKSRLRRGREKLRSSS